ncbi:MAG: FAD-linked oxidase C-terminal domain-containing protein, partial [Gammaproteobacteria bacterium]
DPPISEKLRALIDKAVEGDSSALDAYAVDQKTPAWTLQVKFYGPPKTIPTLWDYAKERFSRIPGATFADGLFVKLPLTEAQKEAVPKNEFGIPALSIWEMISRNDKNPRLQYGHQGLSPIIPRSGEAIFEANRIFARAGREHGLPVPPYCVPFFFWQRSLVFIFLWPVAKDPEENAKYRESLRQLVRLAAEAGFGEYRAHPIYQEQVMRTYSFNNNALLKFHETLKDAVDPNGILSPGRYGIWPKHLRKA